MGVPEIGVFLPSMGKPGLLTGAARNGDDAGPAGGSGLPGDMAATAGHAEDLGFDSVWVVDQLIAGHGAPFLESSIALATAAAATTRVRLGFGVLILPLRPAAWVAKTVASLQLVSGGRVILGVGVGGDRHDQSWDAVGVPRRERGRRTDAALGVLPDLIAGQAVRLGDDADGPVVRLSPPAPVPPILVGGMSDAALARAARYGDGWFTMLLPPEELARYKARLAGLAAERGRPAPRVTATILVAFEGDPFLPGPEVLTGTVVAMCEASDMDERSGPFWDFVNGKRAAPPCADTLGWQLSWVAPERGEIEVFFSAPESFTNPIGAVQGGFLTAMLDDTMGPALVATLPDGEFAVTLELKVSFLRPASPGKIIGAGRVVHRGGSIAFLAGELRDESDQTLATGTATARIIRGAWTDERSRGAAQAH